jgi:hypothetical protein
LDDNAGGRQLLHTLLAPLGSRLHFLREPLAAAAALQPPLSAADLAPLPAELRSALKQAVADLDLARIERLAAELPAASPDLAPRLRAMLERTEFRQLWELL